MSPFRLHNNTNIHLDLQQIECLWSHKIITLNIVAGLDEYLLNATYATSSCLKVLKLLPINDKILEKALL